MDEKLIKRDGRPNDPATMYGVLALLVLRKISKIPNNQSIYISCSNHSFNFVVLPTPQPSIDLDNLIIFSNLAM